MKFLKIINFVFVLAFLLLSMHCKPEPKPVYVSQDTKDFFVFPVGSYWVYVNDSMGIIDTLKLIKFDSTITLEGDFEYHSYETKKLSSFWNLHENEQLVSGENNRDPVYFTCVFLLNTGNWDEIYHSPSVNFGQSIFVGEGSEIIRGTTYSIVRHFISPTNTGDTLEFWFARNIGIVKYQVLHTDSIYELDTFHINH